MKDLRVSLSWQKSRTGLPDHAFPTGPRIVFLNLCPLPRVACGLLLSTLPGLDLQPLGGQALRPAGSPALCSQSMHRMRPPQVALDR